MIDIYRTRRYYNYKCAFFKRDLSGVNDSNVLIHNKKPDGVFYAKILTDKSKNYEDMAGVLRFNYNEIAIQTQDNVVIDVNDVVIFNGDKWFVTRVVERPFQRNAEFTKRTSNLTDIYMRKLETNGR